MIGDIPDMPEEKSRWWKRFKKEPKGYQPTGDSVSWEVAMSQAIVALDHSAAIAIKTKSTEGLKEVARGWLAVAETLSEGGQGMEVHDLEEVSDEYQIGFRAPAADEYDDIEEEEEEVYEPEFKSRAHHTFPSRRTGRLRG